MNLSKILPFAFLYLGIGTLSAQVTVERPTEIQACYETSQPQIKIEVWDAGVEDNDSIRILLNGKILVDSLRLSKVRQEFVFNLNPGSNQLTLFALNLGDIPNNTAAIQVNGKERISLNSGLDKSGSMQILFKTAALTYQIDCPPIIQKTDDDEAKAIRGNPTLVLPSYSLINRGIRFYPNEAYRKVEVQDCFSSSAQEVEIMIWDCGVEDNDTISLFLNGEWILQNHRLTKAHFSIPAILQQGENLLVLYAHNLGDIPRNTAAISIKNKYTIQEVGMMISDENTSGAIRISYGMMDELGNTIPPCLEKNMVDSLSDPEIIYLNTIKPDVKTPNAPKPPKPAPPVNQPAPVIIVPPTRAPQPPTQRRRPVPPATRPTPPSSPKPVPPSQPRTPEKPKPAH